MTGETEEIATELRDMALTASGNSLDRGCQNCGIAANVAETAAALIERQAAEIACLTAEVDRLKALTTWRPIDDEAKSGIPIWLSNGFHIRVGIFANDQWSDLVKFEFTGRRDMHFVPTLWMPLPAPPTVEA